MTGYNIYALKYAGPLTSSGAMIMWLREWDKTVERNYCKNSPPGHEEHEEKNILGRITAPGRK